MIGRKLTGQFAHKPIGGLVNSLSSQVADSEVKKITELLTVFVHLTWH